ncbi:MAG: dienelactone hydrolase family protein [Bauldia sp.]
MSASDPHAGGTVLTAGAAIDKARGAMILVHGRGASAADILSLAEVLDRPDIACFAPEASNNVWYPLPFTAPAERNEPHLGSALKAIASLLADLSAKAMPPERIVLLGFSQGACLALTFAARNPMRYGGVAALSGGLIGADLRPEHFAGSLAETPVFLGCSDVDPHIPLARVKQSAEIMLGLGGTVTERIYPGFGHAINQDEIDHVRRIVDGIGSG